MKFQVRDGFNCKTVKMVSVGNGRTELQESVAYPGNVVEFTAEEATQHAHKLEPRDAEATAWLEAQHIAPAVGG